MLILHIRKIMEQKGLSPNKIAPYMTISERTIYRIYQNRKCPTLLELEEFSKILDVPIEDLFQTDCSKYNEESKFYKAED